MTEKTPTIQKYEVEGYNFEQVSIELEESGCRIIISHVETKEVLADKILYSLTSLITFFEKERPLIINEWIAKKLEADSHE